MFPNRLALPVIAVACVVAAGTGGYFAARQNTVPAPAAAQSQPADFAAPSAATKPVQETEALVGDTAKPAAPVAPASTSAPAPAPAPASTAPAARSRNARRNDPAPRSAASASSSARQTQARNTRQDPPPLSNSWPSNAGSSSGSQSSPTGADMIAAARADERAQEAPRAPEPPQKTFEELVVSANSVIGITTETRLSSETAKIEDRVDAKVSRDVRVGDKIAVPAGSKAIGSVTLVERGGKFKDRARLGIRFHTLVLADGTKVPINTEAIYREGDAPGNSSAAKVGGGAVGGAIIGAILGGAKGAAIGAAAGGGGGTAAVMASSPSVVIIPAGTPLTARITSPVTVTAER